MMLPFGIVSTSGIVSNKEASLLLRSSSPAKRSPWWAKLARRSWTEAASVTRARFSSRAPKSSSLQPAPARRASNAPVAEGAAGDAAAGLSCCCGAKGDRHRGILDVMVRGSKTGRAERQRRAGRGAAQTPNVGPGGGEPWRRGAQRWRNLLRLRLRLRPGRALGLVALGRPDDDADAGKRLPLVQILGPVYARG